MTVQLLEGIRVLDLTRVLAGPYCTMMLGDLGADVLKVEAPGRGDDTRHWGPPFTESGESAYFLSANRNKRSITLNLKETAGQEILKKLIADSDVLVENFRTGTLEKWGLDYDTLQQIRPGLIYCTVTGYGYTGPYKDKPGYDFMVQAMGGFMSVTGPADGEPVRAGIAIADLSTGIFACNAILAALFQRERTGNGHRIDLALLDTQVAMMSYVASNYLVSGELPTRLGNGHPNITPYQSFTASDVDFAFAAGNDRQWQKFCQAIERPDWSADPKFATNAQRVQNRDALATTLNNLFKTKPAEQWISLCEQIGIPAAPINTIDRVFNDPQVQARQMRQDVPHPVDGSVPQIASPMKIPTAPPTIRRHPPTLGQDTIELLTSLGYDEKIIAQLQAQGII